MRFLREIQSIDWLRVILLSALVTTVALTWLRSESDQLAKEFATAKTAVIDGEAWRLYAIAHPR